MKKTSLIIATLLSILIPSVAWAKWYASVTNPYVITNGLVGWWTMDGNNMINNVADSSGNGNNGFLNGFTSTSSAQTTGNIGQSLNVNASADTDAKEVSVPINSALNLGGGVGTFSMWIYPYSGKNGVGTNYNALINNRNGNTAVPYEIVLDISTVALEFYNGTTLYTTSFVPSANKWTLITVTVTGSGCTFYQNATLISTSAGCGFGTAQLTQPLTIGYSPGNNIAEHQQFYGKMDDVRIYNRALSASEITQLYQSGLGAHPDSSNSYLLQNGLVGWWTMDGRNVASNVTDSSGQGNNGYMTAAATSSQIVLGKIGQGLKFNGTSQYISVPNKSSLQGTKFTTSAWIFQKSLTCAGDDYCEVLSQESATKGYSEVVQTSTQKPECYAANGSSFSGITDSPVGLSTILNTWYLFTCTDDGTTLREYINGVQSGTPISLVYSPETTQNLDIGKYTIASSRFFNGTIDDARVYNRALSASEITQLYQSGLGVTLKSNL